MSKWVVDIHGEIEGDYDIIKKYEEPKTDVLDKIRAEIENLDDADYDYEGYYKAVTDAVKIIDKYKAESENKK